MEAGSTPYWLGFGVFSKNLPALVQWIAQTGPREGLAPLIAQVVSGEEISNKDTFGTMSWNGISNFRHWLSLSLNQEENLDFPVMAHRLVGLGPGLTPSGDDFWCGVMIALHALGHFEISEKISGVILNQAENRTNKISRAHLECAARGQGAKPLHETISAMGMADKARLSSALRALDRLGHTSGWDSLAGVVCVVVSMASSKATNFGMKLLEHDG